MGSMLSRDRHRAVPRSRGLWWPGHLPRRRQKMPRVRARAYDLAAAALVASIVDPVAAATVNDVTTHRLDNGLTLHVAPGHPAPVAAVQAWVGVGSADESPGSAGIAHAVEHMLFK